MRRPWITFPSFRSRLVPLNGHFASSPSRSWALARHKWTRRTILSSLCIGTIYIAYNQSSSFRYLTLSTIRCSRIAEAAILDAIDYKWTLTRSYSSQEERTSALSECHSRSAIRVRQALLVNGGVFIKLGQHVSSLLVLPIEWRSAMRPLQDRCEATAYQDLIPLFEEEMGGHPNELFDYFDEKPIGVASLAQVHVAKYHKSGTKVAVKVQHPHIAEFCDIDLTMVQYSLGWIKYWFPEFEFTWLGDEMRQNLPREMDFIHEARNAEKAQANFRDVYTSLHIPEVLAATKRLLIMEFIDGGRVDDLDFLAEANIDRNKVALEISRIFSRMLHTTGFFHADAHPGNILIRRAPLFSRSPYNFEICLLDHGLYFDLEDDLRVNYAKFCLSLMSPGTPENISERKRLAQLVGNIGPDLYPVFEAALTGRANMAGSWGEDEIEQANATAFTRASSLLDMQPQSEAEMDIVRNTVVQKEGLLTSVFDLLRQIPRRMLMVLKVNDLSRALDHSLKTTHSNIRIFLITAKECSSAVWKDDQRRIIRPIRESNSFTWSIVGEYFRCWWRYETTFVRLTFLEMVLDVQAYNIKFLAWLKGLRSEGLAGAHRAASGLAYT